MKLLIICIIGFLSSCDVNKESSTKTTMEPDDGKKVNAEVIREPFINQGGRVIEDVFDYFLKYEAKKWFIKFMDSSVNQSEIEPLVGKKATFLLSERQGLWDTDDPNVQSRIGDYVVIWNVEY